MAWHEATFEPYLAQTPVQICDMNSLKFSALIFFHVVSALANASELRLRCDFKSTAIEHDGSRRSTSGRGTIDIKEGDGVREIRLYSDVEALELRLNSNPQHFTNRQSLINDESNRRVWKMQNTRQYRHDGNLYSSIRRIEIDRSVYFVLGELSLSIIGGSSSAINFSGDCREIAESVNRRN